MFKNHRYGEILQQNLCCIETVNGADKSTELLNFTNDWMVQTAYTSMFQYMQVNIHKLCV